MGIFQKSVIQKHLGNLDKELVEKAFQKFRENYNPSKIEEIKELKEEEYQDGFLRDLFVDVFGYILRPDSNYNLAREFKNQGDGKKADGAILKNEKAVAVIELKSTKTKDLKSITEQAFNYKNNQPDCKYVITSNFQKLRFYIDYANEFEEFDLFHLQRADFDLLFLILNSNSIFSDLPLKLKEETKFHEQDISDKLYKDYSVFKNRLFEDLIKNNPEKDKLTLFNKSQKLLDRFLFILFAEDSGLLPPNSISRIIDTYHKLTELDAYKPIYDIYKQYFGYMNIGRKGKTTADDIPAYNGGLFYPDNLLDNLKIDDEVLISDLLKLSEYDFNTEVDVNILGHIFEHSLSEIEEITAEIEGTAADKTKSKRKKDGVFYTPKYITQYIVENTIGTLCNEKRKELEIEEIEFDGTYRTKDGNLSVKGKKLFQKLNDYKEWLLSLKIVDPACGSGAFLNQALNFLIQEHSTIDDIIAELTYTALRLFDTEKSILENNLFGVDINEESVEIAKLSLWLRTAQKGRKLSNLNNNIKCGNSLIDDPEVAGDKAFDWNVEFKEIMRNGGFDVVIGNPPYVNMSVFPKKIHNYFQSKYELIHTGYNDLMYYFLFKGIDLLNRNGVFGMITSNYFIGNDYAKNLRKFLASHLSTLINFENYHVFKDANIHTAILLAESIPKSDNINFKIYSSNKALDEISYTAESYQLAVLKRDELNDNWIIADKTKLKLINKIKEGKVLLGNITEIAKGSESGKNEIFTISKAVADENQIENEVLRKCIKNSNISPYVIWFNNLYLIYADNSFSKEKFPNAYKYLENHKEKLLERRGPRTGEYEWWRLHRPSVKDVFDAKEKILVPYRASKNKFGFDNNQFFNNGGDVRAIRITNNQFETKYVIAVLNSKLIDWYYGFIGKPKGNSREYFNKPLSLIPIPVATIQTQDEFKVRTDTIILKASGFQSAVDNFINYLHSQISTEKLNKKLQDWYHLDFNGFINELNKAIKSTGTGKLSKSSEMDWMEVFEKRKSEVHSFKTEIDKTKKEIDQMVYELYGLTDEEIRIIEESTT
ncbi:MAG: restriction endonuclease subunit M [Bacteroidetes bacterium]|nr:MAG: restriction endonuclease subunit M [Bacteroidota bacterium]